MKNFRLLKRDIDIDFIIKELEAAVNSGYIPKDFGLAEKKDKDQKLNTYFEKSGGYLSYHHKSAWQYLLGPHSIGQPYTKSCNDNSIFLYKTNIYQHFPKTITYLKKIAKENNAFLQRATFALLLPGGDVLPHDDIGEYYKSRDRYHLVLRAQSGSEFTSGDEKQIFRERELWWFANKEIHSVKNLSASPRIHIIFDLLPKKHYSRYRIIINSLYELFFQKMRDVLGKEEFEKQIEKFPALRAVLIKWP